MTDTQTPDKRDESETQVELKTVTSEELETTEPQENITTLPGEHLRRLREENNKSVKQVADSLHLEIRIIETLEDDDYDSGIPNIFMKGYIRNYAKLMETSPEPLIAAFDTAIKSEEKNSNSTPTPQPKYQSKKQAKSNDLWPKLVTLAILLTLIIFIALWQFSPPDEEVVPNDNTLPEFNESSWTPTPESTSDNDGTDDSATPPESTSDNATPSESTSDNATPPELTSDNDDTSDSATENQTPATLPEETPVVEQPNATPSEPLPPVAPDHTINVNFKGTVWMRITDSTNKQLFQGTGREGKSLTLEGTPPYRVRVGNFNDVDIEYQGDTKDVKDYPKYQNKKKTFLIGGE